MGNETMPNAEFIAFVKKSIGGIAPADIKTIEFKDITAQSGTPKFLA
ncbi:hypothetical protein [Bacteroides sp.]